MVKKEQELFLPWSRKIEIFIYSLLLKTIMTIILMKIINNLTTQHKFKVVYTSKEKRYVN